MKKVLFYVGTIILPVLLLVIVEGIFRLAGYAENRRNVFEDVLSKPDYVAFNPDYVGRYFNTFEPAIAFEPFLKKKEPGSFRVFVLGGSSTAGYPHQPYYGFPAILGDRLAAYAAGQRVEVINLGMTAVNSYTIWDLTEEVLDHKPDAVVIYAGHNEYYGAFGAGSNINSLGNRDFLKRTLLRLKHSVLFMALEDLIRRAGADVDATQDPRTMMARVVRDSEIELDGEVYRQGIDQFERNIGDVVRRITGDGIPVYIGTLVSNIVNQRPLGTDEAAFTAFDSGLKLLARGETNRAREAFSRARDLDNIRFRAPSAINDVIREMSKESGVIVVDLEPFFNESPDLFIDHLHPTYEGYRLIAQAFFDRVKLNPGLRENQIGVYRDPLPDVDPFEKRLTGILIERLLSDYPFTKEATQQEISTAYSVLLGRNRVSSDVLDSLAAAVLSSDMSIQEALLIGARRALVGQDELRAVQLYNSLVRWQPFNESFLKEIVSWAVQNAELDPWTSRMAFFSARRTNDEFHWNSLAASLIRTGRVEDAEKVLDISENLAPDDPIMLYNRARSAAMRGDTTRARMYFERFQKQQAAIH